MTNSHVISALRLKRAEISGHIHDLEKRIARQRANLANLDATIKLFSPGTNPDAIPPKRAYRRTRYFAHNELSRLTQDALRMASGPLTSAEIAGAVIRPAMRRSMKSLRRGRLPCCGDSRSAGSWRSPGLAGMHNGCARICKIELIRSAGRIAITCFVNRKIIYVMRFPQGKGVHKCP